MRAARGILASLLLGLLLWPENAHYRGERALHASEQALRLLLAHPSEVPDPQAALDRISAMAKSASADLPQDSRPRILLGNLRLLERQPESALEEYRRALLLGERAETDLHLARAYEAIGRDRQADTAFVRGIWISPALLRLLTTDIAQRVAAEVARLESELAAGRLQAPPPLP